MQETMKHVLSLCFVEVEAEKRRAKYARIVREARRKRTALLDVLRETGTKRAAPRGRKSGTVRKSKTHNQNLEPGRAKCKLDFSRMPVGEIPRALAAKMRPDYLKKRKGGTE